MVNTMVCTFVYGETGGLLNVPLIELRIALHNRLNSSRGLMLLYQSALTHFTSQNNSLGRRIDSSRPKLYVVNDPC